MTQNEQCQMIFQGFKEVVSISAPTTGVLTVALLSCALFGIQTYFNLTQGVFSIGDCVFQNGHLYGILLFPFYHKTFPQLLMSIATLPFLSGSLEKCFGTLRFLLLFFLMSTTLGSTYTFLDFLQLDGSPVPAEGLLPVGLACVSLITRHTHMTRGFLCGVHFPSMAFPLVLLLITTALVPQSALTCNVLGVVVGWMYARGCYSVLDLSEARAGVVEKMIPFRWLRSIRWVIFVPASKEERNKTLLPLSGVFTSKTYALPRSVVLQRQGPNKDAEMDHEDQTDPSSLQSASGNGDTVNLSDTEPEEDAMADNMIISGLENGLPSISRQSGPASRSGSPQDLDTEMQVDQTRLDRTDLVSEPVTLSNGNIATPTNEDHCCTLMEVETSNPAMVAPPSQGPITVSSMQHHWAIRDHTLYCQSGTWEKKEMELSGKDGREIDGKTQDEESLEQLTDMIHEFLESFYMKYGGFIPLSETDVLEYLKQKGNSDLSNKGVDIKREMTRYRAGLASAPIAGFMVTYNKHTLGLEDLGTLEEQNWLNDQIINMYGELIMEATQHKVHFFNSFFHKQLVAKGYDGVKRWTKKVDLFSKWLLLIPIHLEIHWSLVTVTMATKTISYYDSQGIVFRHTTDNIMKYLLSEAREKKQTAFQKGWKITIIKGIPQQKNDSDCGVFVLEYCRCLSVKQPLLFSQEDMPRIRKRIYKELCDCRLND